jgi:hypothetical protein
MGASGVRRLSRQSRFTLNQCWRGTAIPVVSRAAAGPREVISSTFHQPWRITDPFVANPALFSGKVGTFSI